MAALRVGVVGGGLIAQAVHVPNLDASAEVALAAIADPSRIVAEGMAARYGIPSWHLDWRAMLDAGGLDAIVVCSPHATHAQIVLAAIELGIHCLVEKPLCIDPADAETIAAAADAAGVVVQIGYMKRYDPAFDLLLAGLPDPDGLRMIDVTTYDPWMSREPYVPWGSMLRGDDIPDAVLAEGRLAEARQVGAAVGADDPATVRSFSYTFLACLVHDVNLIHGVLERWGLDAVPVSSAAWADGKAASAELRLANGARWRTSWLLLPGLERFEERVRLSFRDQLHTLTFPVPYHETAPTVLEVLTTAEGAPVDARSSQVSDSYVAELAAFVAAVRGDAGAGRTPALQSVRDLVVLRDLFRLRE